MTPNEYQEAALKTAGNEYARDKIPSALSLAGEVGEYVDIVKKQKYHNISFEKYEELKDKIFHELGDIAWSLAVACHVNGYSLEEVMRGNIEKLRQRHPNGYSPDYLNKG